MKNYLWRSTFISCIFCLMTTSAFAFLYKDCMNANYNPYDFAKTYDTHVTQTCLNACHNWDPYTKKCVLACSNS